jgi:AraC-like DNA-binding protein
MLTLSGADLLQSLLVCNALLVAGYVYQRRACWPLTLLLLILAAQMGLQLLVSDQLPWLNLAFALCYGPTLLALVRYLAWADQPPTAAGHWLLPLLLPALMGLFPQLISWAWPLVSLQLLVYAAAIGWQLKRFQDVLKANFSQLQSRQLDWLSQLLAGFLMLALFDFSRMLLHPLQQRWQIILDQLLSVGLVAGALLLVYLLIWRALQQQLHFPGVSVQQTELADKAAAETATVEPQLVSALELHMQQQQPYLQHELSLQQLADQLQWPAKRLSGVINQHYQRNFNDFINHYRVEHACQLLQTSQGKEKMLSIQLDSGFASKSVFNLYFKKFTGVSPSQYRQR